MISFYNPSYTHLAVYIETEPDITAKISLQSVAGLVSKQCKRRECTVFSLAENIAYTISVHNGEIAFAYLFADNPNVGISFLGNGEETEYGFHFAPFHLPVNMPAALTFYDGVYHLIYTSSPFKGVGEASFLCHAVSRDLIKWENLPVLFAPHEELHKTCHRMGGAYSGSFWEKDGVHSLFFTRRIKDRKTRKALFSYVTKSESRDIYHFSPEETLIGEAPRGFGVDISEPFVFTDGENRYMLLGGEKGENGALLLYKEINGEWKYTAPLLKNTSSKSLSFPSIYKDGKLCVAICTLSDSGQKDAVWWFRGNFKNERFSVRTRGVVDFGGDFYGPRILCEKGRTLLFAASAKDGKGALLIPRVLSHKKGKLLVSPCEEIYTLLGEIVYEGKEEAASLSMPSAYHLSVSFAEPSAFAIMLSETDRETICFVGDKTDCGFKIIRKNGEAEYFPAGLPCTNLEIFSDGGIVEAFVNEGWAVGTKMLPEGKAVFKSEFQDKEKVKSIEIREMGTIQKPF